MDKLDVEYDFPRFFKNAFGRVSSEASRLFCSEIVNLAYVTAGIDTGFTADGKAPTPADINKFTVFRD